MYIHPKYALIYIALNPHNVSLYDEDLQIAERWRTIDASPLWILTGRMFTPLDKSNVLKSDFFGLMTAF